MRLSFKSLSLVSLTLLLSLGFPVLSKVLNIDCQSAQAQTIQNRKDEALRLNQKGKQQYNQGRFREAMETFEQALAIARKIGDRATEATTLNNIGLVYQNLGEYGQALDYHQQALAILRKIGYRAIESPILNNIGSVYEDLGEYGKALDYYQQALASVREIGYRAGEGTTLNNIGSVYGHLGEYGKAKDYFQQSFAIRKEIGDKAGEGITLANIGEVYQNLGEYGQALDYYQQALAIAREIGDRAGEGTTLSGIGGVYRSLGEYGQALDYYQQALAILRKIGYRAGEGTTLSGIGGVYQGLGDYGKALDYHQQALAILRKIGDRAGEGKILNNIGVVYDGLGDYGKALDYYQQALAILRKIGDRATEATILNGIGAVYDGLGEYGKALDYYQQALAIAREIGGRAGEGATLANIGGVYDILGEYGQALDYHQQALAIVRKIGDRAGEGTTLGNIAVLYLAQNQYENAERFLFQAIEVLESLRPGLTDPDKVSIFETQSHTYSFLQHTLIAQNKINDALEISERGRARAFVELLVSRQLDNPNNQLKIEPPNIQQIQQIAKQQKATLVEYSIIPKLDILNIWIIKPTGEIAFKQVDFNLGQQIAQISQPHILFRGLQPKQIETWMFPVTMVMLIIIMGCFIRSAFYFSTKPTQKHHPKLAAWLLLILGLASTGGLGFFIWQSRLILAKDKTRSPLQPPETPLAEVVKSNRPSISVRSGNETQTSDFTLEDINSGDWVRLNDDKESGLQRPWKVLKIDPQNKMLTLTQPTFDNAAIQRPISDVIALVKSPHIENKNLQKLYQLLIEPIADLLPTNPNAPVIFIPQGELFLLPFAALQDSEGKYLIQKHTILTAPSIQVLGELGNVERENQKETENLVVGNPTMPTIPITNEQLPPLPGAEKEAKQIATLLNTQPILGNQATLKYIIPKMERARIIHLATHGLLGDTKVFGSPGAIALADGFLTSREILNLKLNKAELVVLSACNTGKGKITGDGVIGLSRSLITAGVPSVLVSLWSVPDAPTSELMTLFYQNLQKGMNKAQALRQAMLTMMEKHPEPVNWAGFTLMGEAE